MLVHLPWHLCGKLENGGLWFLTEIFSVFFCHRAQGHRPGSRAGGSEC